MSYKTKIFLGVLLFVAIIASIVNSARSDTVAPIVQPPLTSVGQVKIVLKEQPKFAMAVADKHVIKITDLKGEFRGTGFAVSNSKGETIIVTAEHVTVDKAQRGPFGTQMGQDEQIKHLLIWDKGKRVGLGTVIYRDEPADVAFLKLEQSKLWVTPAPIALTPPNRGDTLHVVGHPYGFTWSYSKGYLMHSTMEVKGETRGLASMAGTFGQSGSPVFNDRGEVVGIVSGIFGVGDAMLFIPVALWKDKLNAT